MGIAQDERPFDYPGSSQGEVIHPDDLEAMATVKAEIAAARGFLGNLLDSPPDPDLTLAQALADAAEWAHDTWHNYA